MQLKWIDIFHKATVVMTTDFRYSANIYTVHNTNDLFLSSIINVLGEIYL